MNPRRLKSLSTFFVKIYLLRLDLYSGTGRVGYNNTPQPDRYKCSLLSTFNKRYSWVHLIRKNKGVLLSTFNKKEQEGLLSTFNKKGQGGGLLSTFNKKEQGGLLSTFNKKGQGGGSIEYI